MLLAACPPTSRSHIHGHSGSTNRTEMRWVILPPTARTLVGASTASIAVFRVSHLESSGSHDLVQDGDGHPQVVEHLEVFLW